MKSINLKSLWIVVESISKKVKKWKHYLPIINLILFTGVAGLAIICMLKVYYSPENIINSENHAENIPIKVNQLHPINRDAKTKDYYELMLSNNPLSPSRTTWNPPEIKTYTKQQEEKKTQITVPIVPSEKKPKGTPKNIALRGILILGDNKKALIENPDQTKNKDPFIFVEEGEEVAEYKVKSIEPDQIKIDWYGEEQIIIMRSNIKK